MVQTQAIIDAITAGKVCLVARFIEGNREHVELVNTFDNEAAGRDYLRENGENEFSTMLSSYRLEGNVWGNGKIIGRTVDAPELWDMELIGTNRVIR